MKFTLPGLYAAMGERGLDVDDLAEAAKDAGRPVSADSIRKALRGGPVMMTTATRIAAVLESRRPRPVLMAALQSPENSNKSEAPERTRPPAEG